MVPVYTKEDYTVLKMMSPYSSTMSYIERVVQDFFLEVDTVEGLLDVIGEALSEPFCKMFGVPYKDLPLYINGTPSQVAIIKWRLTIGK